MMLTGIVRFWAYRIKFDESRLEEVPGKLKDLVADYIKDNVD